MDYIERLKQIRIEKGLDDEAIAQGVGIRTELLRMIELGELLPTEKQYEAIMEFVISKM